MRTIEVVALVLLGAIWGASFLFIRIVVPALGPFVMMFVRVLLAGIILYGYAILMRHTPHLLSRWREFIVLGLFSAALPFSLIAFSQLTLNASLAAIINSTTPLFTAVFASIWGKETLTWKKILGVFLGIGGVAILVGGSPISITPSVVIAALASLAAAMFYGVGAIYASNHFAGLHPLHFSIGLMFGASVVLVVPAAATIPSGMPSSGVIGAFLGLIFLSTAFAYILYFFLLNNVGPTRAMTVTFLVPVFGTLWGMIFLNEKVSAGMLVGMVIILMSVGMVLSGHAQNPQASST